VFFFIFIRQNEFELYDHSKRVVTILNLELNFQVRIYLEIMNPVMMADNVLNLVICPHRDILHSFKVLVMFLVLFAILKHDCNQIHQFNV